METFIDQIRASIADEANEDAHQAGVAACRAVLAALDARRVITAPPEIPPAAAPPVAPPPVAPPSVAPPSVASPRSPTPGEMPALIALRALPRDQILDHVIAKLKALQPEAAVGPVAIGTAITALRSMSLDQVVDVGVAKLRTFLTAQSSAPSASPIPPGTRVIRLAPVPGRGT